jgi:hypothetical protein
VTNADIIALIKVGLSDDVVLSHIAKNARKTFDLSTSGLVALKAGGVSDRVITVMMGGPDSGPSNVSRPPEPPPSSPPPAAPDSAHHVKSLVAARASNLPTEVGVYVKGPSTYMEVEPEVANWKTGGFWKSVATGGILRGHVNGTVASPSSRLAVPSSIELLIVTPEGTSATEYQILRLDQKADRREFRTMTVTAVGARSGSDRNLIPSNPEKLQARTYLIKLNQLNAGEYGVLPPFAASPLPTSKLYTFTVR